MTLGIFIGSVQEQTTQAAVISNADTISTDLLLPTRVDTNVGGKVFNTLALQELYAKLAGENAEFTNVENEARKKKEDTYANDSVRSIHSGMDSRDIRTANNNRNIVVKIDGKEWIVTALTTKDLSSNSDVILTLMLKDVAYNSKWGDWANLPSNVTDFSANYPANLYSRSYIRAGLLNNGEQYTTNGSNEVSFSDISIYGADGYPFGIYTDFMAAGNITKFLVKPNEVLYQQNENLYDIEHLVGNNWYTAPNEASKNSISTNKWYTNGVIAMQSKTGYYDWGNDLIWLPSLSETGQNSRANVITCGGLWNLDSEQRGVSPEQASWLRSGGNNYSTHAICLDSNGAHYDTAVNSTVVRNTGISAIANGTLAVRPALHLNLSLAEESSVIPLKTPTDVTSTYNGEQQDYFNANGASSWYDATSFAADKANVMVEYSTSSGGTLSTPKPIEQGTYKVRLTIQSDEYVWENGKTSQEIEFTINQKVLNVNFDPSTTPPKATPTNLCSRDVGKEILRIRYTAKGYDAFVPPTSTDIYVATVEIDTSASNNYILSRTYNVQYLGKPSILDTGVPTYNGTEQQYYIQFVNETDIGEIDITVPDEFKDTVKYADGEIRVTNAGKYWPNLNLSKTDGTVMW
ncbi:MAG: hypothetical protein K2H24_01745, partial [Clostridia bacterium]|nr:hypothetical protein [Clostridia bacterium]